MDQCNNCCRKGCKGGSSAKPCSKHNPPSPLKIPLLAEATSSKHKSHSIIELCIKHNFDIVKSDAYPYKALDPRTPDTMPVVLHKKE